MSNPTSRKICYNAKPHLKILLHYGVDLYHGLRDPKIAAWVLQSENNKVSLL
jgi:DNA polymerase I-like protein with 3'-5' exonuclease and polymerase domains